MAKSFSDLTEGFNPARRARIEARKREMRAEMDLASLRRALSLTQVAVAGALDVQQAEVSRIEKRTDILLSTLRRYIEAVGGKLEIHAVFPNNTIIVTDIAGLREKVEHAPEEAAE